MVCSVTLGTGNNHLQCRIMRLRTWRLRSTWAPHRAWFPRRWPCATPTSSVWVHVASEDPQILRSPLLALTSIVSESQALELKGLANHRYSPHPRLKGAVGWRKQANYTAAFNCAYVAANCQDAPHSSPGGEGVRTGPRLGFQGPKSASQAGRAGR